VHFSSFFAEQTLRIIHGGFFHLDTPLTCRLSLPPCLLIILPSRLFRNPTLQTFYFFSFFPVTFSPVFTTWNISKREGMVDLNLLVANSMENLNPTWFDLFTLDTLTWNGHFVGDGPLHPFSQNNDVRYTISITPFY